MTNVTATDITLTVGPTVPGTFTVYVTTPGGTSTSTNGSRFTVTTAAAPR